MVKRCRKRLVRHDVAPLVLVVTIVDAAVSINVPCRIKEEDALMNVETTMMPI